MNGKNLSLKEKVKLLQKVFTKDEIEVITGALTRQEWFFDERITDLSNHNSSGVNTRFIKNYESERCEIKALQKTFDGALFGYESLKRLYPQSVPEQAAPENEMKRFTLNIDTSAASAESKIYVYEADTIKDAKDKLAELNLTFEHGYIYCATIGEKADSDNRYFTIERTDNGVDWYEENSNGSFYTPESRDRVDDWKIIDKFRKEPEVKKPTIHDKLQIKPPERPAADNGAVNKRREDIEI